MNVKSLGDSGLNPTRRLASTFFRRELEDADEGFAAVGHVGIEALFLFPKVTETGALFRGHAFDAFIDIGLVVGGIVGLGEFVRVDLHRCLAIIRKVLGAAACRGSETR